MPPEFKAWPKIERWRKQTWAITEKIDGTNACVIVPENKEEPIACQSRNRILIPGNDNFGFAKWVEENAEKLRWLGPGYHYGEWWGSGVGRGYGLINGEKRFSLFDAWRWDGIDGSKTPPPCCNVVPLLEIRNDDVIDSINFCMQLLRDQGSKAAPGFMKPEGIVILHVGSKTMFKKLLEGDEVPKGLANEPQASVQL